MARLIHFVETFYRHDGMMALAKHWQVAPAAERGHLQQYQGISPVLAQVLFNRGMTDPAEAHDFLFADDLAKGSLLAIKRPQNSAIDRALTRIRTAIKLREQIVVYGDFDADGVTSTTLLVEALKRLGANVRPYIPHRVDEGYGLNSEALLRLARSGARLIVTVDCGIRAVQEVEDGKAAGLDIIITDHHSVGAEIPNALAVINPKLDDEFQYSEAMLAGVGVAYRLAEALYRVAAGSIRNGAPPNADDLLDLVAIGTVADLVPLNRLENRMLVKRGLSLVNRAQRLGLRALIDVSGLKQGGIGAEQIGFGIAPRINAAGRLESAMIAYDLLSSDDWTQAAMLANQLHDLNTQRQEMTRAAQELVREQLTDTSSIPLIFASDRHFQPGIVGLVAGRLVEEFFRPAVVMEVGETESRASCRSIPQFDITDALDQCAALLVRHGGHAQAAGFTVLNENVTILREKLMSLAHTALDGQDLAPTLDVDMELDAAYVNLALAEGLLDLEPTGHGNPTPVFVTRNLRVQDYRTVGRDDSHLKLRLSRRGGAPIDAIGFGLGEWAKQMPRYVDIAYQLTINEWNGNRTEQMTILDLRETGAGR
ncbi:MAG: single-stranded-DNA-specific exonuclease RecJ [Anaerolineae bacterium]|nr:single-stranded-DNA-specific exonuclease RecJ [Anaerolineae bacterium]